MQSNPLFQQARQDCKRHNDLHAAQLLDTLAKTSGLAPDAVTFAQEQKAICLKDAGQPIAATNVSPPPLSWTVG